MTSDKPIPAEDWRARRAACVAGDHSDRCPRAVCPVKAAWTAEEKAAYDQRRQAAGLPPAANADRWDDYREHKAACRAGNHSDRCPDKFCPVKRKWTKAMWAEYRDRENARLGPRGRPFLPGVQDERHELARATLQGLAGGGWHSKRVFLPLAAAILKNLLDDPATDDYLRAPQWVHELAAWSRAEAQVMLITDEIDRIGAAQAAEETQTEEETITQVSRQKRRRVTRTARRESLMRSLGPLERQAAAHRKELGLTPMSRAKLSKEIKIGQTVDLAKLMEDYWAARKDSAEGGEPGQRPHAIGPAGDGAPAA